MKIKKGFVVRNVGGECVVVPVGEMSKNFHGMIKLNETGADIWRGVADGLSEEEIAKAIVEKYSEVDMEEALSATKNLITQMKDAGILE